MGIPLSIVLYIPFFCAVASAPLLFGSVKMPAQVVLGFCLGLSLLFQLRTSESSLFQKSEKTWICLGFFLLIASVIPLPVEWVETLSPQRVALAEKFPIELGEKVESLPLTISPSRTIQRVWQLTLVAGCFVLGYRAAGVRHGKAGFVLSIAIALTLLLITEWWLKWDGKGVWSIPRSSQAGTFFNRNHFANWVSLASILLLGASLEALQKARHQIGLAEALKGWTLILLILLAILTSISTGSRGGMLSLSAGLFSFFFFAANTRWSDGKATNVNAWKGASSRKPPWFILVSALVLVLALVVSSANTLNRFAEGSIAFRARIWAETFHIFTLYPMFGTGLGTFMVGFSHYKTFHGYGTFLHAENDYIQALMECGVIPLLALGAGCILFLKRNGNFLMLRLGRLSLFEAGLLGGMVAFLVHAFFEFVFHTMANAMMFASMAGFLMRLLHFNNDPSLRAESPEPTKIPDQARWSASSALLGVTLLAFVSIQGVALLKWRAPNKPGRFGQIETSEPRLKFRLATVSPALAGMHQAVSLWPLSTEWQLVFARSAIAELELTKESNPYDLGMPESLLHYQFVRARLTRGIALDPYDWRLRLERAWLDLAFGPDFEKALEEARLVLRLNPLQPELPLRFAEFIAERHPFEAMDLLRRVDTSDPNTLRRALTLCWRLTQDPSSLWEISPATTVGFLGLGEFAVAQGLSGLAVQAFAKASADPTLPASSRIFVARQLLRLGKTEMVLKLVQKGKSMSEQKLAFYAWKQSGKVAEAIRVGETLCRSRGMPTQKPETWQKFEQALQAHNYNSAQQILQEMVAIIPD